jgi:diguanylate cyclase (GGDEF)-like protein
MEMKGRLAGAVARSMIGTIGRRLAVILVVPLVGMALFGSLAAASERADVEDARALRRQAELVELLSMAAIALDIEFDSLAGLREADALAIDASDLVTAFGIDFDQFGDTLDATDQALVDIEAMDPSLWAAPKEVDRLIEASVGLVEARDSEVSRTRFDQIRSDLVEAVDAALSAQTNELDGYLAVVELDPSLSSVVASMDRSRRSLEAAQAERQALVEYLLPLTDEALDDRYRRLVATTAQAELLLTELREHLPPDYAERLSASERSDHWVAYVELREAALAGRISPTDELTLPVALPYALVGYVDGFQRTWDLLDLDRELSAGFTDGALDLEHQATDRLVRDGAIGLILLVVTVAHSLLTISSITGPMRDLHQRAKRISEGDLATTGPRRGPNDIGLVHTTLDTLSANLQTLSAQAEALSAGRLEDEVFGQMVAGPLGKSVHGSVARLRSMTARLEHEANHDTLTGLPNRAALLSLLDRCLTGRSEQRTPLVAIMLDLDGFKQANDDLGHAVGDEVLVQVARRLRRSVRGGFVARLGGDEFMVVLTGASAEEQAAETAAAIVETVRSPIAVSAGTVTVSASAGYVATGTGGEDGWLSPTEVLRRVDLAMYEAKLDVPGLAVRFDQRLHDSLLETTRLQGELRRAVDDGEFELYLQPIVATTEGSVVGYEALLRWNSPARGQVAPGLFIPVAEQSELIVQIDRWVIDQAVDLLASFQRWSGHGHLGISVNVSARHLSNLGLVETIRSALDRHGARPEGLVIEVTESQLIPNLSRAEASLRGLRELGVRLAIDDFGTGYASVAHLRRVQFDRLKIDQSFLAHLDDETDRSLAGLLVSLGRDLDLEVVAEGIEGDEQFAWARSSGCTHAQGYLLGRPAPASQFFLGPSPARRRAGVGEWS